MLPSQASPTRNSAQMQPVRHRGGLRTAPHAQLAEDPRDVHAGGLLRHVEGRPDLTVGGALADQGENLALARGEPKRIVVAAARIGPGPLAAGLAGLAD